MACNLRCTYCFEKHTSERLCIESEDKIINFFRKEIPKKKQLRLSWFGGEPLLNLPSILRISSAVDDICKKKWRSYLWRNEYEWSTSNS